MNEKIKQLEKLVSEQEDLIKILQDENKSLEKRLFKVEREKQQVINSIIDSMNNERTHIGYNVLKQLAEGLEIL